MPGFRQSLFDTRESAGRSLAAAVAALFAERPEPADPVVLALPRGGVPVALEVARALQAPLDLVLVRKIGAPRQPELAAAAIADGAHPTLVRNEEVIRLSGMTEADLERAAATQLAEIERRRELYRADRRPPGLEGRDVVVVDDGVATGATMRAALRSVRRAAPASLTLAVPVAAGDTLAALRAEVDHVVCLDVPEPLYGIGAHYRDFHQLDDSEVRALLREGDRIASARAGSPGTHGA